MAAKKKVTRKPAKKAAPRKKPVKPIPDGYRVLTPYLAIDGAAAAIDFLQESLRRQSAPAHGHARRKDRSRGARHRRLGPHARR
jgi:hypothetical protein